jgi:CRP-like cAMP-binding protein
MLTYRLLRQKPQVFKNLTGISVSEFDKLDSEVTSVWTAGEQKRLTRSNRQRAIGGGRNYTLDLQEQLLMTLLWLHLSLNTEALGFLFGVDKSTVSRNTHRMRTALTQLDTSGWPEPPKRRHGKNIEQTFRAYPDLQIIVNEIEQTGQSTDQAKQSVVPAQLIAQTPPFQNLFPSELDTVRQAAHLRHVERQSFFYYQDDPATNFYLLIAGQVRLSEVTPEGHQVLVRFVSPGEAIGIIAVLKNSVYPLAAQAVEDCQALAWDSASLERLMERFPRIAINGLRLVSQRWHEVEERYRELATERVERRIAQTLLRLVRQVGQKTEDGILINLPLTRQDLADMTGTTHYTVSRILSQWEQEKLIETGRGRVLICYPHGLTRIAEDLPFESP